MTAIKTETRPQQRPAQRTRRRWLRYSAIALAALLVMGAVGTYGFARRSLPQITGMLQLKGLSAPVTVYRDEWGVPHIEAQTRQDLFRAQGYVTAQDRLWEMDLSRRAAAGRLSEVLGESQAENDKFLRTLRLRRAAEISVKEYSPVAMEALTAYGEGVNAYIGEASAAGKLPVEFALLGYKPEPWTPADSASVGKFMAYDLGGNFTDEIYHYLLRQKVGDAMARQLWPVYPDFGPTIVKSAVAAPALPQTTELPPDDSRVDLSGLLAVSSLFPDQFAGSNNWVVSGKLTATGKPILSNDPHLALRTPSIWYQTHLVLNGKDGQMNVIGVIFPGAPGIVIGHNDKVAWGVTNTGPDVQDLYIEKRNPENPYQFEFQGEWENAAVYKEPIKVKGGADIPFEVVVTRHGAIISEVTGGDGARPKEALALKWTALMPTTELEAVLLLDQASNWTEFRDGLKKFLVPTQNFVFASVDGTIAYHAGGIVPIRARGDGTVPVPGNTGEYEWTGFIPFDQMPEVVNPPEGYIATANNRAVDDAYPYFITSTWAQPYRAMRIIESIQAKSGSITADDMRMLQGDFTNLQARTLLPVLLPGLEKAALSDTEQGALALLKGWDQVDAASSGAPLVYQLWWKHLNRMLYLPLMGDALYKQMSGYDQGNVTVEILRQGSRGTETDWLKKAGGLARLTDESFRAAVAEAVSLQGKNPQQWNWGQYHQIGPAHPIGGAVKPLGWLLNPKRYPVGGSDVTVAAMSFNRQTGIVTNSAPWRQVVDMANIAGNSHDVVTPGQAGHFLSPWYASQELLHLKGELHPQLLAPEAYRQGTKLLLQP
jgi:penicillin G amidase